MTFKPARLLLALIAVAAMPAFAQNVAVVNGKGIPLSRVDDLVKQAEGQGHKNSPDLQAMIRQELIMREVMMQEATKRGFDKDAAVREHLEGVRQEIVVNALMRDYVQKHPVTDAEIKAKYDSVKAENKDAKQYHVRHILLATEPEAKAVIAKLKSGAKFDDLAKGSKDPRTASTGGNLDWQTADFFPAPFSAAMVALQKGGVTQVPVKTDVGYHVIKVDDTRALPIPSLEEIKPKIAQALQMAKAQAYQEELVKKATIK